MKIKFLTLFLLLPIICVAQEVEPISQIDRETVIGVITNNELEKENREVVATATSSMQEQEDKLLEVKRVAQTVSILDSVTTHVIIHSGGVEMNPLINTSPVGLIALAGAKLALLEYADRTQSPKEKAKTFSAFSGLFTGVTVNNLLILASASNPVAIVGGIIAGVFMYNHNIDKLKDVKNS